jgi:hypothetical protein
VKGQPLTLKARVTGGVGGIEHVTLYYALFRDAAPFRVVMSSSGMDTYVGTIEAGLLTGADRISYYLEVLDREGTIEETSWYDVVLRNPDNSPAPLRIGDAAAAGSTAPADDSGGISGMTIGLIAGGAVAVGAAAYLLADSSDSDGGGGDGGGSTDPQAKAGTYNGVSTLCNTRTGESPVCSSSGIRIVIDSTGRVVADNLASQPLVSNLSGNSFTLIADISDPATSLTGTIVFNGTVVDDNRIVGNITGNSEQLGVTGVYSGTFSANK